MALRFRLHPYLQQLNFLVLGISRALKYSSHVKLFFLYLAILVFNFTCFSCLNCFIITFIIYKISLYYYFKISSFIFFYFFLLSFSGYSNYLFCSLSNCIFKINRSTFYFVVLLRLYFYVFSMSSISFFFLSLLFHVPINIPFGFWTFRIRFSFSRIPYHHKVIRISTYAPPAPRYVRESSLKTLSFHLPSRDVFWVRWSGEIQFTLCFSYILNLFGYFTISFSFNSYLYINMWSQMNVL